MTSALLVALLAATASAGDAITLEAVRAGVPGHTSPSLTVHAHTEAQLDVSLDCGGGRFAQSRAVRPGDDLVLTLDGLALGSHACRGRLQLRTPDGGSAEMPLSLDVELLSPIAVTVDLADLDLEARHLVFRANRPVQRISLQIIGEGGRVLGETEAGIGAQEGSVFDWPQEPGEVLQIRLTAWDDHGFSGGVELSPWSYAIPHEDVVFASGSHEIREEEVWKLERCWEDVARVRTRYGDIVKMKLYVAGYTDTVGPAASNQELSERRARAIAAWFRGRGFDEPIHFQGFGERALAVSTPDETDEQANRRSVYLLSADTPPISGEIPDRAWTVLR